jgi:hypothetical protein
MAEFLKEFVEELPTMVFGKRSAQAAYAAVGARDQSRTVVTRYETRGIARESDGGAPGAQSRSTNQQKRRLAILNGDSLRVVTHWSLPRFYQLPWRRKSLNWWAV